MTALDSIANARADVIAAELPQIIEAADRGSVIAKDRCTSILVKLAHAGYAEKAVPILVQRLKNAPANQFPTYAEQTASVLTPQEKPGFLAVLAERIGQIGQKSQARAGGKADGEAERVAASSRHRRRGPRPIPLDGDRGGRARSTLDLRPAF